MMPMRAPDEVQHLGPYASEIMIAHTPRDALTTINRGEIILAQIANHMFCMGLAEKSFNVSRGIYI